MLAFNHDICDAGAKGANGGMTLVQVSDPAKPRKLVEHAGDIDPETGLANEIHSVFIWDAGEKAYEGIIIVNREGSCGAIGDVVTITVDFNGWGYLYANGAGKLTELDTYAIKKRSEGTTGFGRWGDRVKASYERTVSIMIR